MAKIRHIALKAKDPAKLAQFYIQTFGMKVVAGGFGEGSKAINLSDGYINLAINEAKAGMPEGIGHFGFQVENSEGTARKAVEAGAQHGPLAKPRDGRGAEIAVFDPLGTKVDLSEHGWDYGSSSMQSTEKTKAAS
jgi:catechol 2,3-dioxygenase-like lactoylglutathione lyase family enzyme